MGVEFEIKYRATPEQLAVLRAAVPGQEQVFTMQTTYYDTPDHALSARTYTLRRRLENGRSVCTLKTPADGLGRKEYAVTCDCLDAALPMLCKLSDLPELPALFSRGIIEICGAQFTRIAKDIVLPTFTAELALDIGTLTGGEKKLPLCEVEVELKSGSETAMLAYAQQLAKTYDLKQETASKFRRALALARGE